MERLREIGGNFEARRYLTSAEVGELIWEQRSPDPLVREVARDLLVAELRQGEGHRTDTFRGADLRGVDLRGTDLRRRDLSGADLRGADLRGADLTETELTFARLEGARVGGATRGGIVLDADMVW